MTQFITDDGTDTGKLVEMRRFYIQARLTPHAAFPSHYTACPPSGPALLSPASIQARVALHSVAWHSASGRRLPAF